MWFLIGLSTSIISVWILIQNILLVDNLVGMKRWSDVSINNVTFSVFPFLFLELSIGDNVLGKDSFGTEVHIKWTTSKMS